MSVFTIEHYAAKASLHKALNEAEQRVTTGIPPEEVMVKLGSELDLFVEVEQRWGVTLQYKEKILKLFRELQFKATPRLHRLVAGGNGGRLHSDVGPRALDLKNSSNGSTKRRGFEKRCCWSRMMKTH